MLAGRAFRESVKRQTAGNSWPPVTSSLAGFTARQQICRRASYTARQQTRSESMWNAARGACLTWSETDSWNVIGALVPAKLDVRRRPCWTERRAAVVLPLSKRRRSVCCSPGKTPACRSAPRRPRPRSRGQRPLRDDLPAHRWCRAALPRPGSVQPVPHGHEGGGWLKAVLEENRARYEAALQKSESELNNL